MSYGGETASEAQERLKREKEAAAFLSSLGPNFEKARATSPAPGTKQNASSSVAGHHRVVAVNGAAAGAGQRHVAATSSSPGGGGGSVKIVSAEAEEKRQQALRRLKATHCSVNSQDKVRSVIYVPGIYVVYGSVYKRSLYGRDTQYVIRAASRLCSTGLGACIVL